MFADNSDKIHLQALFEWLVLRNQLIF